MITSFPPCRLPTWTGAKKEEGQSPPDGCSLWGCLLSADSLTTAAALLMVTLSILRVNITSSLTLHPSSGFQASQTGLRCSLLGSDRFPQLTPPRFRLNDLPLFSHGKILQSNFTCHALSWCTLLAFIDLYNVTEYTAAEESGAIVIHVCQLQLPEGCWLTYYCETSFRNKSNLPGKCGKNVRLQPKWGCLSRKESYVTSVIWWCIHVVEKHLRCRWIKIQFH